MEDTGRIEDRETRTYPPVGYSADDWFLEGKYHHSEDPWVYQPDGTPEWWQRDVQVTEIVDRRGT